MATNQTLIEFISTLIWTCLVTCPSTTKNPIFDLVLSSETVLEQLIISSSMSFAPGLLEALVSRTPPTVVWFKKLPPVEKKLWGVYLIVMVKTDSRPRVYIGSGTDAINGVWKRAAQHSKGQQASVYVKKAFNEGFTVAHSGLLCWTALPSAVEAPVLRVLVVALEAALQFRLWTLNCKTEYGYSMAKICEWARNDIPYDGLCSHNTFYESVPGNHDLSSEQLEAYGAELIRRRKVYFHQWRERTKAQNPEEYKAKANQTRRIYVEKHPEACKESDKRVRQKAREEERFKCKPCDKVFSTNADLRRHLRTPSHARKAGTVVQCKTYPCKPCGRVFNRQCDLTKHLGSETHKNRAAPRGNYRCDVCNATFSHLTFLDRHYTSAAHISNVAAVQETQ